MERVTKTIETLNSNREITIATKYLKSAVGAGAMHADAEGFADRHPELYTAVFGTARMKVRDNGDLAVASAGYHSVAEYVLTNDLDEVASGGEIFAEGLALKRAILALSTKSVDIDEERTSVVIEPELGALLKNNSTNGFVFIPEVSGRIAMQEAYNVVDEFLGNIRDKSNQIEIVIDPERLKRELRDFDMTKRTGEVQLENADTGLIAVQKLQSGDQKTVLLSEKSISGKLNRPFRVRGWALKQLLNVVRNLPSSPYLEGGIQDNFKLWFRDRNSSSHNFAYLTMLFDDDLRMQTYD